MTAVEERPRRADAVRNRARVVAAAAEVFAARGLEASVPEIAARAGVGKATVYRSFPTKEHLVAAVVVERLAAVEARARAALAAEDAWRGLVEVLVGSAEQLAGDRALAGGLTRTIRLPELEAARASMWAALDALLDRARACGGMRADVTSEDLRVLWAGMCRVLADDQEDDPAAWRRYAALVASAIRTDGTPAPRS
jgi:AcrR family transcriptional regulator